MGILVYIASSLDGYIADRKGSVEWLSSIPNPGGSDFGFAEFMSQVDAVVMGRKTFQTVLSFDEWPYDRPVYVISHSLSHLPERCRDKAFLLDLGPKEIIEKLRKDGMQNLYIDGGSLIQSFLAEDLIDEMIITTIPVLLGGGIPLFGSLKEPLPFRHHKTEVLMNSLVKSQYIRRH